MDFNDWIERLRAPNTRRQYRANILRFSGFCDATPEETLEWSNEQIEHRLDEFKYHLLQEGLSGRSVVSVFTGLRRWFKDHRKHVLVDLRDMDLGKSYLDYIPSRKDVQCLFDDAKLHHKVAIALMAFSGLRPVDVVNLKYENIKASYEAGEAVLTVVLRQKKTRDWYFTFLGPQGLRYLREHLERREHLDDDSYIFHDRKITAGALCRALSRLIVRTKGRHPTGESFRRFRPYTLRKYFRRTISRLGENVAEFLMGHRSGVESLVATYSGLRDMDHHAIKELKRQYVELLPELETEVTDLVLKAELQQKEKQLQKFEDKMDEMRRRQEEIEAFLRRLEQRED